jgi:hypothetical protein
MDLFVLVVIGMTLWYPLACIPVLLEKYNILLGFGHGDFEAWTTLLLQVVAEFPWGMDLEVWLRETMQLKRIRQ